MPRQINLTITDDFPFWNELEQRAPVRIHGSGTSYVRELIERDLSTHPLRADILEFLTRELLGTRKAARLKAVLRGRDQVEELESLLERYIVEWEDQLKQAAEGDQALKKDLKDFLAPHPHPANPTPPPSIQPVPESTPKRRRKRGL